MGCCVSKEEPKELVLHWFCCGYEELLAKVVCRPLIPHQGFLRAYISI